MTLSEATNQTDTNDKDADVRILLIGERKLFITSYFFPTLKNFKLISDASMTIMTEFVSHEVERQFFSTFHCF